MSDLKNPLRTASDLISGLVATAALGGTVFALHLPLLAGAAVAAAVYGGTKLLLWRDPVAGADTTADTSKFVARGRARTSQLRTIAGAIENQSVRAKIAHIAASAEQIFTILETDPQKTALARGFVEYTLDRTTAMLVSYRDLARQNMPSVRDTLLKVESLLDTIEKSFAAQIEKLVLDDVASLDSEIDVLKTRLEFEGEE